MIAGCAAEELPADFEPGADCIRVTIQPIPPEEDDPHDGEKHVYYCGTPQEELWGDSGPVLPVPDGTTVLKTSRKLNQEHDWLIARAENKTGPGCVGIHPQFCRRALCGDSV